MAYTAGASAYAAEPTNNHSSHGGTVGSAAKSSFGPKLTTPKLDVHKNTTTTLKVSDDHKFPKLNTGYTPKVDKTAASKFLKKDFDHNYHKLHGTKFEHGYKYCGKNHCHWSYCCWDPCCGCYLYWDPCVCYFYYFCEPDCCCSNEIPVHS